MRELNIEEKRVKADERAKVGSKQPEEHSLVKSKHRKQNGGQKKIVLGGPKENEARKVSRFLVLTNQKRCRQWFQPAQR